MVNNKPEKPVVRLLLGNVAALGPGKIELIIAIGKTGSISGAAKIMGMSYRRAWNLVDSINQDFSSDIVITSSGGKGGGGAELTPLGKKVITIYREMENKASKATQQEWNSLKKNLIL